MLSVSSESRGGGEPLGFRVCDEHPYIFNILLLNAISDKGVVLVAECVSDSRVKSSDNVFASLTLDEHRLASHHLQVWSLSHRGSPFSWLAGEDAL